MNIHIQGLIDMPDDLPWAEDAPRKPIAAVIAEAQPAMLAGEGPAPSGAHIPDANLARLFCLAGHAVFTVVSKRSGARFTFRMQRPKEKADEPRLYAVRRRAIWISVLAGSDNTSDYAYLGTVWEDGEKLTYAHGRKSRIGADAPSAKAALWVIKMLNHPELMEQCEIWHEGACGRCGRRLTVPESIASGIGPECARKMEA